VRRGAVAAAAAAALVLGSCGESDLPAGVATTLQDQVALIRQAAEEGRPGFARSRLNTLVELVASRLERGVIDEERSMAILEAAEAVKSQLSLLPQPSPAQSPDPSPSQEEGTSGGEGGKGEDKDKGKGDEGHGNDD
jgi:hypothetical protein